MEKRNGKIQIYTGDGKGKTTASLGLSLRAIGSGKKVAIVQFMKKGKYSEHRAIAKYKLPIDIKSYGIGYYKIMGDKHTKAEHKKAVLKALDAAKEKIYSGKYDLVILDEVNVAIGFRLLDVKAVLDVINNIPPKKRPEIVLTGRRAHSKLKKIADLVTEMKPIKHYFEKGVQARKGIEY